MNTIPPVNELDDLDCMSEDDDESTEVIDVSEQDMITPSKRVRVYSHHKLRSFCEVRWYSAWMVMARFYELYEALITVSLLRSGSRDQKTKEFITAMGKVKKEELLRALHYLYPLVEAINYCQKDTTSTKEVIPLIRSPYDYYKNSILITLKPETQKKIFDERFRMYRYMPEELYRLFTEAPREVNVSSPEVQQRVEKIREEAYNIFCGVTDYDEQDTWEEEDADRRPKLTASEAIVFLQQCRMRKGLSTTEYFSIASCKNPNLHGLWLRTMSRTASSAAVERSFSAQALLQTPHRN